MRNKLTEENIKLYISSALINGYNNNVENNKISNRIISILIKYYPSTTINKLLLPDNNKDYLPYMYRSYALLYIVNIFKDVIQRYILKNINNISNDIIFAYVFYVQTQPSKLIVDKFLNLFDSEYEKKSINDFILLMPQYLNKYFGNDKLITKQLINFNVQYNLKYLIQSSNGQVNKIDNIINMFNNIYEHNYIMKFFNIIAFPKDGINNMYLQPKNIKILNLIIKYINIYIKDNSGQCITAFTHME